MRRMRMITGAVLAALLCAAGGGCNIVGPAYYFIHGPEKAKKLYALDKELPTVVFIDDRSSRVPRRALRIVMGEEAEGALLAEKVLADVISAQSSLNAAAADKYGQAMPIAEVGRAVGADVVIYATVDSFTLTPDGTTFAPTAGIRVKVIDARKDERLWPEDPVGAQLLVRLPPSPRDLPRSTSEMMQAENELAVAAGRSIARMFYDHEPAKGPNTPR